jgi:threonylcarbamoyladenosine tRNA methylthiotransferase MtaB
MQKTVAFHTLGCKLNFAETSTLARQFEQNNFRKVNFDEPADVYVINTCSVTEDADRECRRIIRNALRNSPDAFVIVTGCYAQLKPETIASIKGVDLILGASEKFNVIKFLNGGQKKEKAEIHSCAIEEADFFNSAYSLNDRTRAFLKIQDGCDYNCSYCTIPLARGRSRSNTIENIISDVKKIAQRGIKEIVLSGVNVGDFGKQMNDEHSNIRTFEHSNKEPEVKSRKTETFFQLIKALDYINSSLGRQGDIRFRISSIEPNLLSDEIIEFVAHSKRFVPHFHIPLQSGSNKILKLMRRRYRRELYAERVHKIKSLIPHCCIGADVIVGFPGETEDDFLDTYNFIDSLDISYLHVFTYSERENTDAIKLRPIVPVEERRKRNKVLRNLSSVKKLKFYKENIGKIRTVLFEEENKDGFMYGFTENYVRVKTKFNPRLVNQLVKVRIEKIDEDGNALAVEFDLSLATDYTNSH